VVCGGRGAVGGVGVWGHSLSSTFHRLHLLRLWTPTIFKTIIFRNWTVSHTIGCNGYDPMSTIELDDDMASCLDLALDQMKFMYPLCPFINETAETNIDLDLSEALLFNETYARQVNSSTTVGCLLDCKQSFNLFAELYGIERIVTHFSF
jgi:hypothetical protein